MELQQDTTGARRAFKLYWAVFGLLLLSILAAWVVILVAQSSYPRHVDEAHLSRHALHMLRDGDPNPHWFRYGSLPIYLTAAGMALGTWIGQLQGSLAGVTDVWSVAGPYYSHLVVMLVPKLLFLLIGVCGLACAGLLGRALSPDPLALLLPVVVLGCAPLYAYHAAGYLNVDVVAAALVLAGLARLCCTLESTSVVQRVLWPAVLCGAVVATKYNSGVLALPFVLSLILDRRKSWVVLLGVGSLLAFFVFQPFVLIEPERFLADIRFENHHYRTGHPGWDDDPGLPQLRFYLGVLLDNFGWPLCVCTVVGVHEGLQTARRATWLTLAFPVTLLLCMASYRVHFARTVLPAFAVLSVFMALGLARCVRVATSLAHTQLARREAANANVGSLFTRNLKLAVTAIVLGAVLGPSIVATARSVAAPVQDSRVAIARFIAGRASAPCEVIVPVQMRIDPRELGGPCRVEAVNLRGRADATQLLQSPGSTKDLERYVVHAPFIEDGELAKRRAGAWRQVLAAAEPLAPLLQAGSQTIALSQKTRDVRDPKLSLYRLR